MTITEEILAAYIDGKVSDAERKEVRKYLAAHPEMQDLVLVLMDDATQHEDKKVIEMPVSKSSNKGFSDIAYAAAAFAPRMDVKSEKCEVTEEMIKKRRSKMSAFLDELE